MPAAVGVVASAIGSIAGAFSLKGVVAGVARLAIGFGVSKLFQPKIPKANRLGSFQASTIDTGVMRRLVIGTFATGGVLVNWRSSGDGTDPPNKNVWLVYYLSDGPCGDLKRIWIGKNEVYSGTLSHGQTTTISFDHANAAKIDVTYYSGTYDQTADPTLVNGGFNYNSDRKGQGCAHVIVKYTYDEQYQTGFDQLLFEIEGAKFYDRRKDTTAGGSGSHRFADATTWEVTSNPAVIGDHLMLGRYQNNVRTWGVGLDAGDIPYARFAAQANLCDESVSITGGSQKRFEVNGVIESDEQFQAIFEDLGIHMLSEPADLGGAIAFIDSQSKTPVMTIYDDNVIDQTTETFTPKASWTELATEVAGRYTDANNAYSVTGYPDVAPVAWADADNDVRRQQLDFRFETDRVRAQRNARLYGQKLRNQAILEGAYFPLAIQLEKGDWFRREGRRFPTGKTFEVISSVFDPSTFSVAIVAREVNANDNSWNASDAADESGDPVAPTVEAPPALPALRAGHRNHIINGDFQFWQRGISGFGNGEYNADRWALFVSGGQTVSVSRASVTGLPFEYAARVSLDTFTADFARLYQRMESLYQLSDGIVSVSFYARASAARSIQVALTQRYGSGGSSPVIISGDLQSITTDWKRYTLQISVTEDLSAKTIGPNHNLEFYLRVSNSFGWVTGDWVEFTGVQVEKGSSPTEFEYRRKPDAYNDCLYYYRRAVAQLNTTELSYSMRSAPTESGSAPFLEYDAEL